MPVATLRNASLRYAFEGAEGAPVIVLSNSLGTDLSLWDSQIEGLTPRFRVLRYDTRGHGGSRAPGREYGLSDLGGDVLELLDFLGIVQFHVCGISLGGMTALWLAIHAPDRVLSIMPSNTAARIRTETFWNARIEQVAEYGLSSIVEGTMERWFTLPFREGNPARVEAMKQAFLRIDQQGYLACCAALRDADLLNEVSSIRVPTTVITGTHDPVTPPSDGHLLQQRIAGARYCELNASHLSNVEKPEVFLQTLIDLVERTS